MNTEKIKKWIVFPALLVIGIVVGLMIPYGQIRAVVADIFDLTRDQGETDESEDAFHVEVTDTARKSLGLKVRRAELGSYRATFDIPAVLKKLPGASSLVLSSRFEGMVTRVLVSEGQSVRAGDLLYEMDLTGERLSQAQSSLLLSLKQAEILQKQIDRLQPLVQQGGVANKRYLDLTYEQGKLLAEIDTREQELLLHGLTNAHVEQIKSSQQLLTQIQVRVPTHLIPPQINLQLDNPDPSFLVESLVIKAGAVAKLGDMLCELAYHEVLVVEGHAFESDLPVLRKLSRLQSSIEVASLQSNSNETVLSAPIAYISNHADPEKNTFPFYIYLRNQVESRLGDGASDKELLNNDFAVWKFKPGQLMHVQIPEEEFQDMIVLPREAVAENGTSRIVFEWKGQVEHDHEGEEEDHEHADEYVPREVDVVYMNHKVAVIRPDGRLQPGTRIAFNLANQLLFSMQSGSGHSHDHGHEH